MSVGMLELIKVLLCVGKCSNTELDIILFGDISMHNNGSYCNQDSEQQYSKGEYSLWNEFQKYLMYEYSFIIVIMIFEYYSNTFSTRYKFCVLEIESQAAFFYMGENRPKQDAV